MSQDPRLDDDTSAARVTQGGRGRRGHSIWWVLIAAVLAAAILIFAVSLHQIAPAERNTTSVSGSAPAQPSAATHP